MKSCKRINFFTHGSSDVGFGHLNRCMEIGKQILATGANVRFNFEGIEDAHVVSLIEAQLDTTFETAIDADISIYDRMDDPQRPEVFDSLLLEGLRSRSSNTVFIANSFEVPAIHASSVIVGYKGLTARKFNNPNIFWGAQYTPIPRDIVFSPTKPWGCRSLSVGLGGGAKENLMQIIKIVAANRCSERLKVLLSASNSNCRDEILNLSKTHDLEIEILDRVENVSDFLSDSKVLICSYGHLAYEAISLGINVILVAQKPFQHDYGQTLDQLGLVKNLPEIRYLKEKDLHNAIDQMASAQSVLSMETQKIKIDNLGITRIANIILSVLDDSDEMQIQV